MEALQVIGYFRTYSKLAVQKQLTRHHAMDACVTL